MSDNHGHSGHGHHTEERDPDPQLIAQIGAVATILVIATVLAIQGLYFYFQHVEDLRKAAEYAPEVAGRAEQTRALDTTDVIDKNTGRLQLQIDVARDIVREELAAQQEKQ